MEGGEGGGRLDERQKSVALTSPPPSPPSRVSETRLLKIMMLMLRRRLSDQQILLRMAKYNRPGDARDISKIVLDIAISHLDIAKAKLQFTQMTDEVVKNGMHLDVQRAQSRVLVAQNVYREEVERERMCIQMLYKTYQETGFAPDVGSRREDAFWVYLAEMQRLKADTDAEEKRRSQSGFLAFAMAFHSRLGAAAPAQVLGGDALRAIALPLGLGKPPGDPDVDLTRRRAAAYR